MLCAIFPQMTNELLHEKKYLLTGAPNEDSNQPAHSQSDPPSLSPRTNFAFLVNQNVRNEDSDQTAWIAGPTCPKVCFLTWFKIQY